MSPIPAPVQAAQLLLKTFQPSRERVSSQQDLHVVVATKKLGKTTAGDKHEMQTFTSHRGREQAHACLALCTQVQG